MNLLDDNILGIVDAYDCVHSLNTYERLGYHATHWPNQTRCRWRWDHDRSLWEIGQSFRTEPFLMDMIRNHLTKKFGIKWWENGHHDIDDLIERFDKK